MVKKSEEKRVEIQKEVKVEKKSGVKKFGDQELKTRFTGGIDK